MYFPSTLWTRLFLATAVMQGVLALTLEALVPSRSPSRRRCPQTPIRGFDPTGSRLALSSFALCRLPPLPPRRAH